MKRTVPLPVLSVLLAGLIAMICLWPGSAAMAQQVVATLDKNDPELRAILAKIEAEAEKARVNVTRTIRATIDRIAHAAPRASAHLAASVRTGRTCRYDPAPDGPARWRV